MSTQQILIRLPEEVADRLKAAIPARQRNRFIADLVATAVARHDDDLAKVAAAVTYEEKHDPRLAREVRDWEATVSDGLEGRRGTRAKPQER